MSLLRSIHSRFEHSRRREKTLAPPRTTVGVGAGVPFGCIVTADDGITTLVVRRHRIRLLRRGSLLSYFFFYAVARRKYRQTDLGASPSEWARHTHKQTIKSHKDWFAHQELVKARDVHVKNNPSLGDSAVNNREAARLVSASTPFAGKAFDVRVGRYVRHRPLLRH